MPRTYTWTGSGRRQEASLLRTQQQAMGYDYDDFPAHTGRWYRELCARRGLEPVATYALLARQYEAPRLKGPLNLDARRRAGFDEAELALLGP
jgi:uncharacterized ferritin-like protein (DUF455 family)